MAYTSLEVAAITGTSYRQIDYWANNLVIRPTTPARGSGRQRSWTLADVLSVRIVADLRSAGHGLATLQAMQPTIAKAATQVTEAPDRDCLLFVANDQAQIVHSQQDAAALFAFEQGPVVSVVVVDVRHLAVSLFPALERIAYPWVGSFSR